MADEAAQAAEVRRLLGIRGGKTADPFAVLQLSVETCEVGDVNRSFRRIALLLHPDKCKLPHATDAFHVAERAHKILSQEAVLAHLKRAHEKRRTHTGSATSSGPSTASGSSSGSSSGNGSAACAFGSLSKLAATGLSSEAQKAAEVQRVLQCSANDYFVILDVDPRTCELADVDRRYRRMAQALHPDKCQLPRVVEAFTVFERAHKTLADTARLARYKAAYMQQQQRKQQQQQQQHAAAVGGSGAGAGEQDALLTAAERLERRKRDALREQQLEAARLAEEAMRKKRKVEGDEAERAELAAELERQRREWRDLQLF